MESAARQARRAVRGRLTASFVVEKLGVGLARFGRDALDMIDETLDFGRREKQAQLAAPPEDIVGRERPSANRHPAQFGDATAVRTLARHPASLARTRPPSAPTGPNRPSQPAQYEGRDCG